MKYLIFASILGALIGCGFLGVAIADESEPLARSFLFGMLCIPLTLLVVGFIAFLVLGTIWIISEEIAKKIGKPMSVSEDLADSMADFRDKMKRGDLIPTIRMERCCRDQFCSRCHGEGFIRSEGYLNDWQESDDPTA